MTVHVGELTSEVVTTTTEAPAGSGSGSMWEERARTAATLERLASDRLRTSTGHGHD
jgi:hypothetical protein